MLSWFSLSLFACLLFDIYIFFLLFMVASFNVRLALLAAYLWWINMCVCLSLCNVRAPCSDGWTFRQNFRPSISSGTRVVCIKILDTNSKCSGGSCTLNIRGCENLSFSTNVSLYFEFENGKRYGHIYFWLLRLINTLTYLLISFLFITLLAVIWNKSSKPHAGKIFITRPRML